jgi:Arc/MetJ-type ribon-helix-helix transcriptional regulator
MKVLLKLTTWEEVRISDDVAEEVKSKVMSGAYTTTDDLIENHEADVQFERMYETDSYLAPYQNKKEPTIEIKEANIDNGGWDVIWDNVNKTH